MNPPRILTGLSALATVFVVAACGSAASAGTASTSPSPAARLALRGASGQLVQISGQTLILTGPSGDVTVTFSTSTTITKTSLVALADITVGSCVVATGTKDATTGAITARSVTLSPKTASGCPEPPARVIPTPSPGASPRPSFSPRPSGLANMSFASGQVTAINGTSLTVQAQAGADVTVIVSTTARVTRSAVVTAADLQTGQCLSANGPRDSSGNVQATALTITPAGPSGTCTTGRGGFGGGGGGGFGGGAPPSGA